MEAITVFLAWVQAHPMLVAIVLYVAVNLAKRLPEPDETKHPFLHVCWELFERLMFTAYDRWGGPLKMILAEPKGGNR